ncbi:MAG: hypothetical protein KBD76_05815 [Bacteriovorax sp.]|jgi:MFS family permease|nr:hypothetical protein [Bacteriovorax sp.]
MEKDNTEEIGKQIASLALIEVGLGSLLHSFKIPLTGHFLSINQTALLSRSSFKLKSTKAPLEISLVASILKSLSPAGKKLTPMLAIAAQGLLFYLGLFLGGINAFGLFIAVFLSSAWAFLQPVLFIYLLFGKTSLDVAEHFLQEIEKIFPHTDQIFVWIILALFFLKCIIAYSLSWGFIRMSDDTFLKFQNRMILEIKFKKPKTTSAFKLALRDLFNPLFLFSFSFTFLFFILSQASFAQILWGLLRPLAIGLILFYCIRVYPIDKLSRFFKKKGLHRISRLLTHASKAVNEKNKSKPL